MSPAELTLYKPSDRYVNGSVIEKLEFDLRMGEPNTPALLFLVGIPKTIRVCNLDVNVTAFAKLGPLGRIDLTRWIRHDLRGIESWEWWLTDLELERLEQVREGNNLSLTITVNGVGIRSEDDEVIPLHGDAYLYVPASTWTDLILSRYTPKTWIQLPLPSSHWPNWSEARERFREALIALERGQTHDAIAKCFASFETIEAHLNRERPWKKVLDVDEQKLAGLEKLFSGFLEYTSKVGRHRHKEIRDSGGDLIYAEVNHYDAEFAVAMGILIMAYLQQLPRKPQNDSSQALANND
jgi:hypothetical protein